MNNLLTCFFLLSIGNLFSQDFQKINASAICDSSIRSYFNEFSRNAAYEREEAREIGIQKANCDLANGTKKIIIYTGMFSSNFCKQCFYSDLGFSIEKELESDVVYERDYSHEFASGYNERMNSLLDSAQLDELKSLSSMSSESFYSILSKSQFTASKINDTLINVQLKNEKLENLFPSDLSHIKVSIKEANKDDSKKVYTYSQLRNHGIKFPFSVSTSTTLIVGYNFEEVPGRMKICWCELIEQEFQRSVKITFK